MVYYMASFYSSGTVSSLGNFPFLMKRAAKQIIRPKKSWLCTDLQQEGTSDKSFCVRFVFPDGKYNARTKTTQQVLEFELPLLSMICLTPLELSLSSYLSIG